MESEVVAMHESSIFSWQDYANMFPQLEKKDKEKSTIQKQLFEMEGEVAALHLWPNCLLSIVSDVSKAKTLTKDADASVFLQYSIFPFFVLH